MKLNLNNELKDFGFPVLDSALVLSQALRYGGDLAELFFEKTVSTRIIYESGRVDKITTGRDRGVGLRIIFQGRSVYGYTTDLTQKALGALAETLSEAISQKGQPKNLNKVEWRKSIQSDSQMNSYQVKNSPQNVSITDKIKLVCRAESGARKELPQARQVTAALIDSLRNILVINSDGLVSSDSKTYLQCMVQVVGEKQGRVESAYETDGGFVGMEFFDQVTPESIGKEAARRVAIL